MAPPAFAVTAPSTTAPIGVFDSGVGGLSVLRAIRALLPLEELLYLADSAHAPYGDRGADFVEARVLAIGEALAGAGVKAIVVACNTATVVAVQTLRERHALPIVAMEPAIKPAAAITASKVIGVLATRQTAASPAVARLCQRFGAGVQILLKACPGLVEQVEAGELDGEATRRLLAGYLQPLLAAGADVLVLGCTHYAFLEPAIRALAGPGVQIVDSAAAVARELGRRLDAAALRAAAGSAGREWFFTTSADAVARGLFARLWGADVDVRSVRDLATLREVVDRR